MSNKQGRYVPDWRVDSIDEGREQAEQAEQDYSDRDRPRKAGGGVSSSSIYHYEDND